MPKKILMSAIAGFLVVTLSSCSVIGGKSEAYTLGIEAGKQYLSLKDTADLVGSYIPDDADPENSLELSASAEDLMEYCSGLWIVTGITNGIKNSAESKADYVAGCLEGAGF